MENEKEKKSDLSENVALGANSEMLGRYSEAGKQFKVAYDGIDNATGQKLHQGLKEIGGYKETSIDKNGNVIDNTKTQQGYSAEVLDTAKQNAENIKRGKAERVARTDDVVDPATGKKRVNDTKHDQVTLDADGNVIDGSGVQMKFYDEDSFVDFIKGDKRGKHGKLWADKYPEGKFSVPADQYDSIKRKLQEEIKALESCGDLTAEQRKRLDYVKKVEKNLKKSTVTKKEAVDARKNPKKVTAKEILNTSHEAGIEAAKVGAAVGGGISLIRNIGAVLKGEKEPEEAALDVTKDTAAAGAGSYGSAYVNTAIASVMKNSKDKLIRFLGNANAPAYIIQTATSTAKSMHRLCCGEITVNEFFLEIGKSGTSLLASAQGAVVGQLLIPIPVVGALVGGLVSTLVCETIYDFTIGMRMLNAEIDAFCNQLEVEIALLKEYHIHLMKLNDRFERETKPYIAIAERFAGDHSALEFNTMLKITYQYIGIPCPWGGGSFNQFMNDKSNGRALHFE